MCWRDRGSVHIEASARSCKYGSKSSGIRVLVGKTYVAPTSDSSLPFEDLVSITSFGRYVRCSL